MADDLSLLLRIRGDSTGAKTAASETRAAIASLRASGSADLNQLQKAGQTALTGLGGSMSALISQRIPLLGGAIQGLVPVMGEAGSAGTGMAASIGAGAGPISLAVLAAAAMTAGVIALTQEFVSLTIATADWQGKMQDLSQQVGVSVETLSALEVVFKTTGGDVTQAAAGLGIFQKHLEEAQDPASKAAETFRQLGVETNNTEDALRQTIKSLAEMPEGFAQTSAALEVFGRGGKAFLAIAKESNGDLDGLISRLKEAGLILSTETAKAADKFNDQLALLGFQSRAVTASLVQDSIPKILSALEEVSQVLNENREAIRVLGTAVGLFVESNLNLILLPALKSLAYALEGIRVSWLLTAAAAALATGNYGRAAEAIALLNRDIHEAQKGLDKLGKSGLGAGDIGGGLGGQRLADIKAQADAESQAAKERIANAQIAFDQGQITREKESAEILAAIAREKQARLEAFDKEIALKIQARDAQKDNLAEQEKIGDEIRKLSQDRLNVESDFNQKAKAEQAKALADRNKAFIEHVESQLTLRQKASDNEIKLIQDAIKNNEVAASAGEAAITEIQITALAERRTVLNQELALHGLSAEQRQQITRKIAELEIEATENQREQSERRKQILRDEYEDRLRVIQQSNARELALLSARDDLLIARENAFAAARVKSNEDAERAILRIKTEAIKAEIDQLAQQRAAAVALPDRKRGDEIEADLINRQKILQLQLEKIQLEGNAAVEAARQQDLENAQRYADELTRIGEDQVKAAKDALAGAARIGEGNFGFLSGLETGQLAELTNGIKNFQDVATVAFSAVGTVVGALAQGVGNLIQQWVLTGTVGPNAIRKFVAAALAGLAAQAAVESLMELARAFAALADPFTAWRAPLHFKASAIFAAVAGAAAIAARGAAGGVFNSEGTSGADSGSSRSGANSRSSAPQVTDINRRSSAPTFLVDLHLHGEIATDALSTRVEKAVVRSLDHNDERLTKMIQDVASRK